MGPDSWADGDRQGYAAPSGESTERACCIACVRSRDRVGTVGAHDFRPGFIPVPIGIVGAVQPSGGQCRIDGLRVRDAADRRQDVMTMKPPSFACFATFLLAGLV